jgi:hypothetical protein
MDFAAKLLPAISWLEESRDHVAGCPQDVLWPHFSVPRTQPSPSLASPVTPRGSDQPPELSLPQLAMEIAR